MRRHILSSSLIFVFALTSLSFGQGLHAKIQARKEAAEKEAKNKPVAGEVLLTVDRSYQETFDTIVNQLKKEGFTIEDANLVTGQITTPIEQTKGGYSQKGERVSVTLIKENPTATTLKFVVAEFSRKKAFTAEPWEKPRPDEVKTKELKEIFEKTFGAPVEIAP